MNKDLTLVDTFSSLIDEQSACIAITNYAQKNPSEPYVLKISRADLNLQIKHHASIDMYHLDFKTNTLTINGTKLPVQDTSFSKLMDRIMTDLSNEECVIFNESKNETPNKSAKNKTVTKASKTTFNSTFNNIQKLNMSDLGTVSGGLGMMSNLPVQFVTGPAAQYGPSRETSKSSKQVIGIMVKEKFYTLQQASRLSESKTAPKEIAKTLKKAMNALLKSGTQMTTKAKKGSETTYIGNNLQIKTMNGKQMVVKENRFLFFKWNTVLGKLNDAAEDADTLSNAISKAKNKRRFDDESYEQIKSSLTNLRQLAATSKHLEFFYQDTIDKITQAIEYSSAEAEYEKAPLPQGTQQLKHLLDNIHVNKPNILTTDSRVNVAEAVDYDPTHVDFPSYDIPDHIQDLEYQAQQNLNDAISTQDAIDTLDLLFISKRAGIYGNLLCMTGKGSSIEEIETIEAQIKAELNKETAEHVQKKNDEFTLLKQHLSRLRNDYNTIQKQIRALTKKIQTSSSATETGDLTTLNFLKHQAKKIEQSLTKLSGEQDASSNTRQIDAFAFNKMRSEILKFVDLQKKYHQLKNSESLDTKAGKNVVKALIESPLTDSNGVFSMEEAENHMKFYAEVIGQGGYQTVDAKVMKQRMKTIEEKTKWGKSQLNYSLTAPDNWTPIQRFGVLFSKSGNMHISITELEPIPYKQTKATSEVDAELVPYDDVPGKKAVGDDQALKEARATDDFDAIANDEKAKAKTGDMATTGTIAVDDEVPVTATVVKPKSSTKAFGTEFVPAGLRPKPGFSTRPTNFFRKTQRLLANEEQHANPGQDVYQDPEQPSYAHAQQSIYRGYRGGQFPSKDAALSAILEMMKESSVKSMHVNVLLTLTALPIKKDKQLFLDHKAHIQEALDEIIDALRTFEDGLPLTPEQQMIVQELSTEDIESDAQGFDATAKYSSRDIETIKETLTVTNVGVNEGAVGKLTVKGVKVPVQVGWHTATEYNNSAFQKVNEKLESYFNLTQKIRSKFKFSAGHITAEEATLMGKMPIVMQLTMDLDKMWAQNDFADADVGLNQFKFASTLKVLLNLLDTSIYENCMSGKDRTGQSQSDEDSQNNHIQMQVLEHSETMVEHYQERLSEIAHPNTGISDQNIVRNMETFFAQNQILLTSPLMSKQDIDLLFSRIQLFIESRDAGIEDAPFSEYINTLFINIVHGHVNTCQHALFMTNSEEGFHDYTPLLETPTLSKVLRQKKVKNSGLADTVGIETYDNYVKNTKEGRAAYDSFKKFAPPMLDADDFKDDAPSFDKDRTRRSRHVQYLDHLDTMQTYAKNKRQGIMSGGGLANTGINTGTNGFKVKGGEANKRHVSGFYRDYVTQTLINAVQQGESLENLCNIFIDLTGSYELDSSIENTIRLEMDSIAASLSKNKMPKKLTNLYKTVETAKYHTIKPHVKVSA